MNARDKSGIAELGYQQRPDLYDPLRAPTILCTHAARIGTASLRLLTFCSDAGEFAPDAP
jgi:hypothetical protein